MQTCNEPVLLKRLQARPSSKLERRDFRSSLVVSTRRHLDDAANFRRRVRDRAIVRIMVLVNKLYLCRQSMSVIVPIYL